MMPETWPAEVTHPQFDDPEGVRRWFDSLLATGINFHPEDAFDMVVDNEGERTFTDSDAEAMNSAMLKAVSLCDDVYGVAIAAFQARIVEGRRLHDDQGIARHLRGRRSG
jgi:hypothetical protein